ncbi:uncharacterized protein TOT_010001298 [Theileria orientalis strain Shintoku]|uniref:Flavodoxin-like domain-containing protein n=1 Tax=Theileria orientalis strain Shintoku TaxID=869250 RepID=J4D645_THEOR|nr:uncharacterized protein TOT_010001298 [Theileria orientalis strain Shintoku]BAM39330.1 uncharacterized protein TOT_010001298 [Theileria orientalis strain Shintoku]|eukprot:XP_009689631.1 uncharacterized protein TOT_010001298 [Theileria orientalis strain Shintoku]
MSRCCIVYGSETGSTEIASYTTYVYLYKNGIPVEIHLSDLVDLNILLLFDYVIFFVPTCAFGEFPHNFEGVVDTLMDYHARSKYIPSFKYTIFGLGDSRYPQYNVAARKLHSLLSSLRASEFFPSGLGDDQHPLGYDGELLVWRKDLLEYLSQQKGSKSEGCSFESIVYPFRVEKMDITNPTEYLFQQMCRDLYDHKLNPLSYSRGVVKCNKVITSANHFSTVRSIEIEEEEPSYMTGDVMCMFPIDKDADALLFDLDLDPAQVVCVRRNDNFDIQTVLSVHNEFNSYPLEWIKRKLLTGRKMVSSRTLPVGLCMTLSELFKKYLCLKNACTPFQMHVMSLYTDDEVHKAKLLEMSSESVEGCMEYYRYCRKERRSLYEVLYDFRSVKLPLEVLVNICTPYYSRLYSIASSQIDYADRYSYSLTRYPLAVNYPRFKEFISSKYKRNGRIQLIVGNVNYKMDGKRSVDGLGSRYLNTLRVGRRVDYTIYRPRFRSLILNTEVPVLFIATGTGITVPKPYIEHRSFRFKELWNRHKLLPKTKDMAFMGFRRPSQDHLYADYALYENWCMFVFVYSRAGESKYYVQDSLRDHSKEVYSFLREGMVVIGGKSHPMPAQVLESLVHVLEKEAHFSRESGQRFIDHSIKQSKIIIDTWG